MANCAISNNSAIGKGGGMTIDNCTKIRNCLITDNFAGSFGGGIVLGNNSKVYNCDIENNIGLRGGGVAIYASQGPADIHNSIIYNNVPDNFTIEKMNQNMDYNMEYCLTTPFPHNVISLTGTKTNDPLYLYPHAGDYRLSCNSPGIDTGRTANWMTNSMALNSTNRILFGQPDLGCYEYDGIPELFMPLLEISSPTGWVSYDESTYSVYGGRNINTTDMDASIVTNGITNKQIVSLSGNYDWTIESFELQPEITNTITVTGWNHSSNYVEQTFFVIRGGIGTGNPVISITNAPQSINSNVVSVISGTNNVHVIGMGVWELYNEYGLTDSGNLLLTNLVWQLSVTNLNMGIYSLEIGATNLWGVSVSDATVFEVK
jgi:hypothetical protein